MSFKKFLKEYYQADLEGDLGTEFAKQIISKYLRMAQEEGVKELVASGDIPSEGPNEMVQSVLDELIPKIEVYITKGNIPIK